MFTGIIQEVGAVASVRPEGDSLELVVSLPQLSGRVKRGDSIAINGVCLTVTTIQDKVVRFDVMRQTVDHSMLKSLRTGHKVNAEPALRAGDAMGGHWVQGHVDGTGTIKSITPSTGYTIMAIDAPDSVLRYCVPKGSITVSGVSLTLVDISPTSFTVSLIPTTLSDTILGSLREGEAVNLEVDILGKYVYHYLHPASGAIGEGVLPPGGLTETFLRDHGF